MIKPRQFLRLVAPFFVWGTTSSAFGPGSILDESTTIRFIGAENPSLPCYDILSSCHYYVPGGSAACKVTAHYLNLLIGAGTSDSVICMPWGEFVVLGTQGNCNVVAKGLSILVAGHNYSNYDPIVCPIDRNVTNGTAHNVSHVNRFVPFGSYDGLGGAQVPAGLTTDDNARGPRAARPVYRVVKPSIAMDTSDDDDDVVGWFHHHHHIKHHANDDDDRSDDDDGVSAGPAYPYDDQLNAQLRPVKCHANTCVGNEAPTNTFQVLTNATCDNSCG